MTDRRGDTVRSPLDRAVERGGSALARVRAEGGAAGRNRLRQLEITMVISAQAGLGSWCGRARMSRPARPKATGRQLAPAAAGPAR
ncbi:hypothetical protein AB0K27_26385 [Micromonospora echinospora]|uniref:hypothetical protein n=1 Tax=Micromonospora echinospora TaxID=1877 RepID=UPI0034144EE1